MNVSALVVVTAVGGFCIGPESSWSFLPDDYFIHLGRFLRDLVRSLFQLLLCIP
jgi:hypothetical protein